MQKLRRKVRKIRHWRLHHARNIQPRRVHMHVRINQSRHQHASAAVNHFSVLVSAGIGGGNVFDYSARNYNIPSFDQGIRITIEYPS